MKYWTYTLWLYLRSCFEIWAFYSKVYVKLYCPPLSITGTTFPSSSLQCKQYPSSQSNPLLTVYYIPYIITHCVFIITCFISLFSISLHCWEGPVYTCLRRMCRIKCDLMFHQYPISYTSVTTHWEVASCSHSPWSESCSLTCCWLCHCVIFTVAVAILFQSPSCTGPIEGLSPSFSSTLFFILEMIKDTGPYIHGNMKKAELIHFDKRWKVRLNGGPQVTEVYTAQCHIQQDVKAMCSDMFHSICYVCIHPYSWYL